MVRQVALEATEQLLDTSLTSILAVLDVLRNICQVVTLTVPSTRAEASASYPSTTHLMANYAFVFRVISLPDASAPREATTYVSIRILALMHPPAYASSSPTHQPHAKQRLYRLSRNASSRTLVPTKDTPTSDELASYSAIREACAYKRGIRLAELASASACDRSTLHQRDELASYSAIREACAYSRARLS
jgi:hypothetical protein